MFSQASVCSRGGGAGGGVGSQMCHGIGHLVGNLPPPRYLTLLLPLLPRFHGR